MRRDLHGFIKILIGLILVVGVAYIVTWPHLYTYYVPPFGVHPPVEFSEKQKCEQYIADLGKPRADEHWMIAQTGKPPRYGTGVPPPGTFKPPTGPCLVKSVWRWRQTSGAP